MMIMDGEKKRMLQIDRGTKEMVRDGSKRRKERAFFPERNREINERSLIGAF